MPLRALSVKCFLSGNWLRGHGAPAYRTRGSAKTGLLGREGPPRAIRGRGAMPQPQLPEEDEDDGNRSRRNLLVLIIVVILVVGGVWLVNRLVAMRNLQNCLASGRTNCLPIDSSGPS
jgi:hypothetical protein